MSSNVKDVIYSVYRIRMSDYRIISADENFEKLTGYTEKDYRENQLKHTDLIPAEDIVEYMEKMMQIRRNQNENIQEHRLVKKNGDIIVVFCYGKIYKDEKTGEMQAQIIVSDVTDTAPLSQVKIENSSYMEISEHDMLTGLYNRGSFEKRVNHDLALLNDGNCAIIVMDIRELKWINDTYGRSAGDMVINNMAANMVSIFRSDVVMSRIGGDEFCLYIPLYEEKMQQQYMDKIMQLQVVKKEEEINQIMKCNELSIQYGLTLTPQDVEGLLEMQHKVLQDVGRVEFHSTILQQIIYEFCDSLFIHKYNYVETINQLLEIFYYYRDATEDYLTDEEIIHYMKIAFDGCCQGSLYYLSEEQLNTLMDDLNSRNDIYEGLAYGDI